jgi:hypothetical protein
MHEIKSFRIFQTAKVIGVLYAISLAIIAALQLVAFASFGGRKPPILLILILPVVGSIFSFLAFAFTCWLYNLIAPHIGGIAFELATRSES